MNATLLLQLWETGRSRPGQRAMLLQQAACPDAGAEEVRSASPGERAHALLTWRERFFGAVMPCVADCAHCGERVEFDLRRVDLVADPIYIVPPEICVDDGSHHVRVRLPSVKAVEDARGDPERLFASCLIEANDGSRPVAPQDLPAAIRARIERELLAADPLLDPQLDLKCPSCEHLWSAPFNAVAYCWSDVEGWARQMILAVHRLAKAYGWSESEVLMMSASRREQYLQLIGS